MYAINENLVNDAVQFQIQMITFQPKIKIKAKRMCVYVCIYVLV